MNSATSLRHETKGRSNSPPHCARPRSMKAEACGIRGLECDPAVHVAAAPDPGGVHAVMDVAFFDVAVPAHAGTRKDVAIAGTIHCHPGPNGQAPLLAFEHDPGDGAIL